ncbi:glycosyltransferase family 2 protein [Halopseudomonas sp.]|uniref:glycosyltransferase family 2 protein n=1 Tax=Halopseudomonas sp. TaxID=2901191 RepID=UPI003FA59DC5
MSEPVVSIVIPTFRRAEYLGRAINSALRSAGDYEVEVIVVPNGPDDSWRTIACDFARDVRVKWLPLTMAGAPQARNHGLVNASGVYVRFLDDDDYLYPVSCMRQLVKIVEENLDICSGSIDVVNSKLNCVKRLSPPNTSDLVVAALGPARMTVTHAHLYRREVLSTARWDIDLPVGQDVFWFMKLSVSPGLRWACVDEAVGAWVQHTGARVSRGRDPGQQALSARAELILQLVCSLQVAGGLSHNRKIAASDGLWACIQKGLRYDYQYWVKMAQAADNLVVGRRPPSRIHSLPLLRDIPPLWVERALIPVRWLYHPVRLVLDKLGVGRV